MISPEVGECGVSSLVLLRLGSSPQTCWESDQSGGKLGEGTTGHLRLSTGRGRGRVSFFRSYGFKEWISS